MNGKPWTPEEDATVRKLYPRDPRRAAKALPNRTPNAVRLRARALGCLREPRWSAEENATLMREWAEVSSRTLRAKLRGRTWMAIREHAELLGLGAQDQRRISLMEACRRSGWSWRGLVPILERQGVRIRRVSGPKPDQPKTCPHYAVDWDEVREAVERDLEQRRSLGTVDGRLLTSRLRKQAGAARRAA